MEDDPKEQAAPGRIEVPESAWEPPPRVPAEPASPVADEPSAGAAERAFGPVVAGLLIDLIDLATFGPIGLVLGLLFGGAVAWYICTLYRLPLKQKLCWALAAGVYCTIPFTEFIPVGTLTGAFVRYRELKEEERGRSP